MGAPYTFTHLFVASALDDNSTNVNAASFGFKAQLDHLDPAISGATWQLCNCERGTLGIGKPIRVSSKDPTHIAEGPGIDLGEFNDLPLLLEHFLTIDAEGGLRLCLESRRVDLPVAVPARSK